MTTCPYCASSLPQMSATCPTCGAVFEFVENDAGFQTHDTTASPFVTPFYNQHDLLINSQEIKSHNFIASISNIEGFFSQNIKIKSSELNIRIAHIAEAVIAGLAIVSILFSLITIFYRSWSVGFLSLDADLIVLNFFIITMTIALKNRLVSSFTVFVRYRFVVVMTSTQSSHVKEWPLIEFDSFAEATQLEQALLKVIPKLP